MLALQAQLQNTVSVLERGALNAFLQGVLGQLFCSRTPGSFCHYLECVGCNSVCELRRLQSCRVTKGCWNFLNELRAVNPREELDSPGKAEQIIRRLLPLDTTRALRGSAARIQNLGLSRAGSKLYSGQG